MSKQIVKGGGGVKINCGLGSVFLIVNRECQHRKGSLDRSFKLNNVFLAFNMKQNWV